MNSKTIRVVLIAAACLGLVGSAHAVRTASTQTITEGAEQQPTVKDLIQNSGYMVAVG